MPDGGATLVSTLLPQLLVTVGAVGTGGTALTAITTERLDPQHPEPLFLALK